MPSLQSTVCFFVFLFKSAWCFAKVRYWISDEDGDGVVAVGEWMLCSHIRNLRLCVETGVVGAGVCRKAALRGVPAVSRQKRGCPLPGLLCGSDELVHRQAGTLPG